MIGSSMEQRSVFLPKPLPSRQKSCYNLKGKNRKERLWSMKKVIDYLKRDVVLTVSMVLAAVSCLIIPPNIQYLEYIDFHTLIMLFCLMIIIEGLREQEVFQYIGSRLLSKVSTRRGLVFTLVFLCFISSMLITNDVSLITFVPFGILILEMTGQISKVCYTVTLMTIAGNLGSMFTPIGNPQNLYLYSLSGLSMGGFLRLMFPYTAAAAILLAVFVAAGCGKGELKVNMEAPARMDRRMISFYSILFLLCILTVAGIIPHLVLLAVVACCIGIRNRQLFARADYGLLLTFIFFFVFVGNIKHLDSLQTWIMGVLGGNEKAVSVLSSQVISNVPAAMLLSGYTDQVKELIVGTNLGGLGTLIASMASLISYKQICNRYPDLKKKYLGIFTVCNLIFLLVLWLI